MSYLEYYLGFWHTTGTTVGTTSIFRATYSATKTSGPPSQCRTAKFASDHYYNSSVERHLEAGDFIICP